MRDCFDQMSIFTLSSIDVHAYIRMRAFVVKSDLAYPHTSILNETVDVVRELDK